MKIIGILLSISLFAKVCSAGGAIVSTSQVKGYFLGLYQRALIDDDQTIVDHCKKKGDLWVLGFPKPIQCAGVKHTPEGVNDGPYTEILFSEIKKLPQKSRSPLFSIKKFSAKTWGERIATPDEIKKINLFSGTAENKKIFSSNKITKEKIKVISIPERTIFFVENRKIPNEFDHFLDTEYIVLNKVKDQILLTGTFEGTIEAFVDINGDNVPEIKVSQHCESICEFVYNMNNKIEALVRF